MENSIYIKFVNKNLVEKMRLMRWSWKDIASWSKKQLMLIGLFALLGIIILIRLGNIFLSLMPLIVVVMLTQARKFEINQRFTNYDNQRQLEFLYLFELLVPHLAHATSSKSGLYKVLIKLEARLKPEGVDGSDGMLKHGINKLILDISNNPGDINSFKEFAYTCSGSELAEDVSIALFDWQQNTDDIQAIERLKKKVHKSKVKRVEQIVQTKISKFDWYSQRQLMAVFIMVLGILGTSIVFQMFEMFKLLK